VLAVDRPGHLANLGLVRTADGVVVIDTTSTAADMQKVLAASGLAVSDVCLVILTHGDNDHTGGNGLFQCPIVAQRLCRQRMLDKKRSKRDLPTESFEVEHRLDVGGVRFELHHLGGHTPDSAVVWLPGARMLFAGDLVVQGRYPIIHRSEVWAGIPRWVQALKWLSNLGAERIVPGHGAVCAGGEIGNLLGYMEDTWARIVGHVARGHSLAETLADPGYVRGKGWRKRLFQKNIELIYLEVVANGGA